MKLIVIGGGRAAWTFSILAETLGADVRLFTRSAPHSGFIGRPGLRAASLEEVAFDEDDLILFAVPDDRIHEVYEELRGRIPPSAVVFHASGALSSEVFDHRSRFSLHPLRSLPSPGTIPVTLEGTLFTWEGTAATRELAESITKAGGGRFAPIGTGQKSLYHAAAVFGANYVAVVLEQASVLMREAGVEEPDRHLRQLALSAIENWYGGEGRERFTGPLRRGEVGVIRAHLTALGPHPEADASYRALAAALVEVLAAQPGEASELHEIRRLIEDRNS